MKKKIKGAKKKAPKITKEVAKKIVSNPKTPSQLKKYWKKKYKSMSPEERRLYIKKKSEQNQHRFKTKPKALEAKRAYDKSDKGIYSRYKNDCKRRNRLKRSIKMLLKFEEFSDILNKRCVYCGEEQCKGVDRLDSDESYTVENSVPCCSICNRMKNSLTEKEFLQHIEKIYNKKKT